MSYDNTLKGALFVNKDKKTDNHPDYRGQLETEDGTEYWVSAWIKTPSKGGPDFLSMSLTPKDNNQQQRQAVNRPTVNKDASDFLARHKASQTTSDHRPQPAPQPAPDFDSFDDDIPF